MNPGGMPMQGQRLGLINVVPASAMVAAEQAAAAQAAQAQQPNAAPFAGLAGYLHKLWDECKQAKQTIETEMLRAYRQRRGEYEPEVLAEIRKFGGSEIYVRLTDVKCRAAEAWIRDVLMPSGDRPWTLDPTPVPNLSPAQKEQIAQMAIQRAIERGLNPAIVTPDMREKLAAKVVEGMRQKARERAEAMATKIEDQLVEGGWRDAFKACIADIVTFKAAIMKGPVLRRKKQLVWTRGPNGKFAPQVTNEIIKTVERRSPWDIYPSPHATTIEDGDLFDRYRMSTSDLEDLIGVEGYDAEAIRAVLQEYGQGGLRSWLWTDSERDRLEQRYNTMTAKGGGIEALNFWGNVQGVLLLSHGADPAKVPDPLATYPVEVWMIGRHIIRADINDDPLGRKPYGKAAFFELPGSWWGSAPPEQMEDCQRMVNGAARAMANNMALASGPMLWMYADRFADGETGGGMGPWRIFYMKSDPSGVDRKPVEFYQPSMNTDALMKVIDHWERRADNVTGIPAYSYGDGNVGGAGKTASGLSMLFNAASKGIKGSIANIDIGIIEPMVRRFYDHNMLYDPDESIKGDAQVVPRGAAALIIKEQLQIRRAEFLQTTANPLDAAIIGRRGRAKLLRENARALDMSPDDIVPTDEELIAQERQQMMQAQQQPPGAAPQTLNAAGEPAGGGDAALFQQG